MTAVGASIGHVMVKVVVESGDATVPRLLFRANVVRSIAMPGEVSRPMTVDTGGVVGGEWCDGPLGAAVSAPARDGGSMATLEPECVGSAVVMSDGMTMPPREFSCLVVLCQKSTDPLLGVSCDKVAADGYFTRLMGRHLHG